MVCEGFLLCPRVLCSKAKAGGQDRARKTLSVEQKLLTAPFPGILAVSWEQ